jgi:tetratricopeptide (TPR) repeat protein
MKHYREFYAKPEDLYNQAYQLIVKGEQLDVAEEMMHSLALNDPNNFVLIFQLGCIKMKKKEYASAEVFFIRAIQLKEDFQEAHQNLGYVLKEMERIEESQKAFLRALEIIEKVPDIDPAIRADCLHNYASTFTAFGNPKKGLELLEEALKNNPDKDDAYFNRGLAHLELGNYEQGFEDYDKGVRIKETKDRSYSSTPGEVTPYWDGTKGQEIVVFGEQGIGDELMFATMLPDVIKDCTVIIDAHPRLVNLFRFSFPGIPVYGTRKTGNVQWGKYYSIDAKCSMASLARYYRKKPEDFPGEPYLKVPRFLVDKYKQKLDAISDKKKIGISWKGGTAKTGSKERKIKIKQFAPLFDALQDTCEFISLQYHEDSTEHIKTHKEKYGHTIHHWQDVMDDYEETAGLISNLDYIISVPQSVVHLAGAMGVPTIQLCPQRAMWQMGPYGQNMPWYSCVENIWQAKPGEWDDVILKAKDKICSLLQNNT